MIVIIIEIEFHNIPRMLFAESSKPLEMLFTKRFSRKL